MKEPNLNGQWEVKVTYGKRYRQHKGAELFCLFNLKQTENNVNGNSIDVSGLGVSPDYASIKGDISSNRFTFIKQYDSLHYADQSGKVHVDKTKKGPLIFYTGEFDFNTVVCSGIWHIKTFAYLFGFIPIPYKLSGTWSMNRK